MKIRRILALMLAVALLGVPTVFAAGCADDNATFEVPQSTEAEIEPLDLEIAYADYSGSLFEEMLKLYKSNGTYLNFYVKNKGTVSVVLTINGENARTLAPGEAGHIYVKVNDILGLGKTYTLRCAPVVNGAKIDITYAIAQRNTQ